MRRSFCYFAAALALLLAANLSFSFDIATYWDPLSFRVGNFLWCCRYGPCFGSRAQDSTALFTDAQGHYRAGMMDSVYQWYREMGVSHVMVNYPYAEYFTLIPQDSSRLKVMNSFYPGQGTMHGEKYLFSQFRNVQVGFALSPEHPDAYWSYENSIGEDAERTTYQPSDTVEARPVVAMGPGGADTLWRATSDLGQVHGWDGAQSGWLDGSIYMPMHFKLTWAVDPNGSISTETPIADFYWIVRIAGIHPTYPEAARWWRFPARTLTLHTLADTNNWIVSEYVDSANSGWYQLLDEDFEPLDSISWEDVHYGGGIPASSLDEVSWNTVSYWRWTPVRMCVYYRGVHQLYLNRIQVWDEGAWRMFDSPDSTVYDSLIQAAFRTEYNSTNKLAGWYFDEWDPLGEQIRSLVHVNKLLHENGLPVLFLNGEGFLGDSSGGEYRLWQEMQTQSAPDMNVHMDEFYPFAGGDGCQPYALWARTASTLWTSFSSDTPYVNLTEQCGQFSEQVGNVTYTQGRYIGTKSIQCAIDGWVFDWNPVQSNVSGWDLRVISSTHGPLSYPPSGLVHLTRRKHMYGMKQWALVQGGQDRPEVNAPDNCCPIRWPSANETRLVAWLALACDVDGIMWYPFTFGGLLAWNEEPQQGLGTQVLATDRYYGAKQACTGILRVAPYVESLVFLKTYASRAFETDYPDSTYEATARDYLFVDESVSRSVEEIQTYLPDGEGGWEETEEEHSYVQISRFRNSLIPENDPNTEDYWFLVVNRRALENESRKITLVIQVGTPYIGDPYFVDYVLGDSISLARPCPNPELTCGKRYVDVILDPGEAELIHFTRGLLPCSPVIATLDSARSVTVVPDGPNHVKLMWGQVVETDAGSPFFVDEYFILGSPRPDGPFTPFGVTSDTAYTDSIFAVYPEYFYMVQACGDTIDNE